MLRTLTEVLTNDIGGRTDRPVGERELALRGRYGYFGFLVAVWSMVIAAVVLAVTPIKDLPHGQPDPIAEGEHRG
jgi:hypothetical protein